RNGVLQLPHKLDLPENTVVQVEITPLPSPTKLKSLYGAFPELAAIIDADLDEAKQIWQEGLEKQLRILEEGEQH
ncbi:MAG: hypothetical protein RMK99_15650, partial [Anaerolineales bacterium]|nr:hypothetical protein [Anaerolineales bacterium]